MVMLLPLKAISLWPGEGLKAYRINGLWFTVVQFRSSQPQEGRPVVNGM